MAIPQPQSTSTLNNPDHSLMHRQIAADTEAPVLSLTMDAEGNVYIARDQTVNMLRLTPSNDTPDVPEKGWMWFKDNENSLYLAIE